MKNLLLFFLIAPLNFYAQSKRGNVWVTGSGGQKIIFSGNGINANNSVFFPSYFTQGNSNICDTNGNLILVSDGFNIYDANANFIEDGDTVVPEDFYDYEDGWSSYSQSSIFLPMDSNKYYFVTPTFSDIRFADCLNNSQCFFDLLLYNVIDMNANGGAGKVVKRMQPLMQSAKLSKTQMMACRHSNGKDWWLLKQGGDSNIVYKFLFTQDSVYSYGFQKFDNPVWGVWDTKGQSMFSRDGSRYATLAQGDTVPGKVFVADSDRCYGIMSNPKILQSLLVSWHSPEPPPFDSSLIDQTFTGLAFSADGSKLYAISQYNVFQYDFQDDSWYHVAGLDTSWLQFQKYSNAYLGPDEKLYIGNFNGLSRQMSVINNPNAKGATCDFCPRCLRLDTLQGIVGAGTPPCMPNYSLGAQTCWPLSISQSEYDPLTPLVVWPNPTSGIINIKTESRETRQLYNSVGQLLISSTADEIDASGYCRGVYYIKVGNVARKIILE